MDIASASPQIPRLFMTSDFRDRTPSRYAAQTSVSPVSTSSIVSRYGNDLNRDYDVSCRLEELAGFEIEPEQLQASLVLAEQRLGCKPTVRQLCNIIQEDYTPSGLQSWPQPAAAGALRSPERLGPSSLESRLAGAVTPTWSLEDGSDDEWQQDIRHGRGAVSSTTPSSIKIPMLNFALKQQGPAGDQQEDKPMRLGKAVAASFRQSHDPDMLRVLLPRQGRLASITSTPLHMVAEKARPPVPEQARKAQQPQHAAARCKGADQQQRPHASKHKVLIALPRKAPPSQQRLRGGGGKRGSGDLQPVQDTGKAAGAAKGVQEQLSSFALDDGWWIEDTSGDCSSVENGLTLPQRLWEVMDRLRCRSGDSGLVERLVHGRQLAHTAFSSVYEASLDGGPVVVKKVDVTSECVLANVLAEVTALDHLSGWDGAVRLLNYTRIKDEVILILQRGDMNMRQWLEQQTSTEGAGWVVAVLRTFIEMASLVEQLHQRRFTHGDVKLDNFLMLDGAMLLSDFGEASMFDQPDNALVFESRGTEMYQSPELLMGRPTNSRHADVWSLGCLLYEMITRTALFPGKNECLRPSLAQQGLNTSRPTRWMKDVEQDRLMHAAGGERELCSDVQRLLHPMLLEEHQRSALPEVMQNARELLRKLS